MDITLKYNELIARLELLYGKLNREEKRFEKASNSIISRDLGYSDAQFSRLFNESATEGEYIRAIQNADRILTLKNLESEVERLSTSGQIRPTSKRIVFPIVAILTIACLYLLYVNYNSDNSKPSLESKRDDMLRWSFETPYINPYVKLNDLPADCSYPCYKYQGKWELKEDYKLPFFRERNGFHYLATEVNLYTRCMSEKSIKGDVIEGYEYQKHEIWYDKRELPMDSFMTPNVNTELRKEYREMAFKDDDNFVRIAYVHTFFRNEFVLDSNIVRSGKVIGRDVEFIASDLLLPQLGSEGKVKDVLSEVNTIINNRLEDFSRPVSCGNAALPKTDFNKVAEGDEISFSCQFTTSRFPVKYTKTYQLVNQFIKNNCIPAI
ncbi:MAG: hypothetical protein ABJH04_06960 [Cyclobacteriaceae bacterium]